MILVCDATNDLHEVLTAVGADVRRVDDLEAALEAAAEGGCILALADDYPRATLKLTEFHLQTVVDKSLRLYVEYPAFVPGIELAEPQPTQWERTVVSSDFFAPELRRNTILALHGCWYLPTSPRPAHVSVARVAGYNDAIYGIPADAPPVLFELPGHEVMIATSKLSQFVTARYGPTGAWKALWRVLLRWLSRTEQVPELSWEPTVGIQAGREEPLPGSAEADALGRVTRWFRREVVYSIDIKKGGIEGFEAGIDYLGRQMRRTNVRSDCVSETGMVFAFDWARSRNPASKQLAIQIMDYVWSAPDFLQEDPSTPVYGLVNWYERGPVFYGDDNARVVLSTIASGALLRDDRWNERVLRCLLANLRTTGPLGFRCRRLDYPQSFTDGRGWVYYHDHEIVDYSPHYQAYLWASFLWGYAFTGWDGFYARTVNAIRMTMEAYPAWHWTNGLTQEMARMLLPLAFLVRVDDTPEHRDWLHRIADDLIAQMQPSGAVREKLGPTETGDFPPPRSNEAYGTAEASLIQQDGDPACDLLYTANYAFIGLHEAAAATGDGKLRRAADRLAEFLCRIQVRSKDQPYLDGAWMRSFDYELWEYWGSSADLGWGAWSVESGWTNTWIAAALAIRDTDTSLFELAPADGLRELLPGLVEEMSREAPADKQNDYTTPLGRMPGSEN